MFTWQRTKFALDAVAKAYCSQTYACLTDEWHERCDHGLVVLHRLY